MPANRDTLVSIFCNAVAADPSRPALHVPDGAISLSLDGRGPG